MIVKVCAVVILYFLLFWEFGALAKRRLLGKQYSLGLTLLLGFFAYYLVFQVVVLPIMFLQLPLKVLSTVWVIVIFAVTCIFFKVAVKDEIRNCIEEWKKYTFMWKVLLLGVALVHVGIVSFIQSIYWDSTYYVGLVSYSVYYDAINIYNPLTGMPLNAFDIKHCFATYHMHDAVVCQMFGLPALVECKTVMVIVISVLLNCLYGQFATLFFGENNALAKLEFLGFALILNLCTYTAYTSSTFIMLRTYEGKAITAAISAMFLLYWYIRLWKYRDKREWYALLLVVWGAVAIASSAIFLTIVSVTCFALSMAVMEKRVRPLWMGCFCMLPALVVMYCYLLNRLGVFEIRIGI